MKIKIVSQKTDRTKWSAQQQEEYIFLPDSESCLNCDYMNNEEDAMSPVCTLFEGAPILVDFCQGTKDFDFLPHDLCVSAKAKGKIVR